MDFSVELRLIRQELSGVERNVARLARRVDDIESRYQSAGDRADVKNQDASPVPPPVAVTRPQAEKPRPSAVPPPLPEHSTAPRPTKEVVAQAKATQEAVSRIEKQLSAPRTEAARPKKPRRFGPPEDMSFEMALGSYWLPRLGMLLVAIGTVWFFTFVAQQYNDASWMPYARVAIGYGFSATLLGIGAWLEKKYTNYGRLLMGGGLGLIYFVTFATWYIPPTRIAPSQEFTLVLLAILVAGWGALAHWRRSQLLAFTMAALGHFTVALSTLSLDEPSKSAVGGLLVLGVGSAWFMYRHGWHLVAMAAMVGSYLNQFFWLSQAPPSNSPSDFYIGMAVLLAYLVIYAVAERITPTERITVRPRERNLFVALNTAGFVFLGLALVQSFPFSAPYDYGLYFGTAIFTGVMGFSYLRRSPRDRLAAIYFVKTSVLVAVGLATWLDGSTLTFSLTLEALILLLMARHNREHTGRILALVAAVITVLHGAYTFADGTLSAYGNAAFTGEALVAMAVVVLFGVMAEVYRTTPWGDFPAVRYWSALNGLWTWMEMAPSTKTSPPTTSRSFWSHALVGMGALLFLGYVEALLPKTALPAFVAWSALGLLGAGLARRSAPLLSGGMVLSACGALWWLDQVADMPLRLGGSLTPVLVCAAPLLLGSELLRILIPTRMQGFALRDDLQGAWYRNVQLIANGYGVAAAALLVFSVHEEIKPAHILLLCGGLSLIGTVYASRTKAANVGLFALGVVVSMPIAVIYLTLYEYNVWSAGIGIALLGAAATAEAPRWWGTGPGLAFHRLLPMPYVLYGTFTWCAGALALWEMELAYAALALLVLAAAIGLTMPYLHRRAIAVCSTALCLFAFAIWIIETPVGGEANWWRWSALALVVMAGCGDRWFDRFKAFAHPVPGRLLLGVAWITMYQCTVIMTSGVWGIGGLAVIGFLFLVYGVAFRTRTALVVSLITGVFATGTAVLEQVPAVSIEARCLSYGALIVYWLCWERAMKYVLARMAITVEPGHQKFMEAVVTATPALLGILCLTRIDVIHDFYLTISWTVWALALFGWALATRQSWFRYVALGTMGVALGRAFLVDVWSLHGLYRVGAMMFLGIALLAVAYGYTRWRATQLEKENPDTE